MPEEIDLTSMAEAIGSTIQTITFKDVLSGCLFVAVAILVSTLILRICTRGIKKSKMEKTIASFLCSACKAVIYFITIIIIAGYFGVPVNSLVALLSIAGLALSLSLQGLLGNLFSGLTILTTKPLTAEDYIEMGDIAGTVQKVGVIHTVLKTADHRTIFIPNSKITDSSIVNFSKEDKRRIDISLFVPYETSPETVKQAVHAALQDTRIHTDPKPFVEIQNYKDTTIEYVLRVWVQKEAYWDVYHGVLEKVWYQMKEHHISMHRNGVQVLFPEDRK